MVATPADNKIPYGRRAGETSPLDHSRPSRIEPRNRRLPTIQRLKPQCANSIPIATARATAQSQSILNLDKPSPLHRAKRGPGVWGRRPQVLSASREEGAMAAGQLQGPINVRWTGKSRWSGQVPCIEASAVATDDGHHGRAEYILYKDRAIYQHRYHKRDRL